MNDFTATRICTWVLINNRQASHNRLHIRVTPEHFTEKNSSLISYRVWWNHHKFHFKGENTKALGNISNCFSNIRILIQF